jgi:uncharacterized membrane protein (GlpM family)
VFTINWFTHIFILLLLYKIYFININSIIIISKFFYFVKNVLPLSVNAYTIGLLPIFSTYPSVTSFLIEPETERDDINKPSPISFDLNKLLNKDKKISSIHHSFFNNLPKERSINNWINFRLTYFGYIFLIIGLITLSLFFSFIALYVLKNDHQAINTLIAAIVFCLIFFIGYFGLMFSYSYVMKKDFKLLKTKFEYL